MNENCSDGDGCGVHYRVNSRKDNDAYRALAYIDYVGQHAVITQDDPSLVAATAMAETLSLEFKEAPTPYDTCIIHVGSSTVYEAIQNIYSECGASFEGNIRLWSQSYREYLSAKGGHGMVVEALRAGLLTLDASE